MNNFIVLTKMNGEKTIINIAHIILIEEVVYFPTESSLLPSKGDVSEKYTKISMLGHSDWVRVKEEMNTIMSFLNKQ